MGEKLDLILQNQTTLTEQMSKLEKSINDMREENGEWFAKITTDISSYRDQQDRTADRLDRVEDAFKSAGFGQHLHT